MKRKTLALAVAILGAIIVAPVAASAGDEVLAILDEVALEASGDPQGSQD